MSIKKDLRKALKGYRKEDYVQFGYYLGQMIDLSTKEVETKNVEVKEEK